MLSFKHAVKRDAKARIALIGVSGSGKTYSALRLAQELGEKIAVIDTEAGSASKYADEFHFDVLELTTFHPNLYIEAIQSAEQHGFDVVIVDSLSHAWMGKNGELELVDKAAKASRSGNSYFAWRDVTPLHNRLIDTLLQSKLHVIVTMRSKTEYIVEDIKGKQVPRKVGMAPVMRDGMEYEFDIVVDLDLQHNGVITKTRCRMLDGQVFSPIDDDMGRIVKQWCSGDAPEIDPAEFTELIEQGNKLAEQIKTSHPKVAKKWEDRKRQNFPGNNIQEAIDYMTGLLSELEPEGPSDDTPDSPEPPADADTDKSAEKTHAEKLQDIAEVGSEEDRMVAETALTDQDFITFNKTYDRVMSEAHAA